MMIDVWITVEPGGDRPYCSTTPPSIERKKLINGRGGKVLKAEVVLAGFERNEDGVIIAVANEVEIAG